MSAAAGDPQGRRCRTTPRSPICGSTVLTCSAAGRQTLHSLSLAPVQQQDLSVLCSRRARDTLAYLLETDPIKLPYAKQMLAQMAERYYQHKAKIEIGGKPFWRWDGLKLALQPDYIPRREAEEFFGVRYAKEALDLDPAYQPAQIVMLNFILERTYDLELDQFFKKPMTPEIEKLLIGVDFDLLMETLERALNENKVPVALPIIEILGKRGDLRGPAGRDGADGGVAARPVLFRSAHAVRRGQALLRMPYRPVPVASSARGGIAAPLHGVRADFQGHCRALPGAQSAAYGEDVRHGRVPENRGPHRDAARILRTDPSLRGFRRDLRPSRRSIRAI